MHECKSWPSRDDDLCLLMRARDFGCVALRGVWWVCMHNTCGHFFESSHAPRVLLFPIAAACAGCFVQGSAALETSLSGANNGLMSLSGVSYSTQFSTAVSTRFLASHGHCCHFTRVDWHAYGRSPQHYQTPPNNLATSA
jgi:hypothetical protein